MQVVSLKERKDKWSEYIKLIEVSFGYQSPFSYNIDFYPLVNSLNYQNCYMLLHQDEVIATCAYQPRKMVVKNKTFEIYFMGGIAVKEQWRASGLGKKIVNAALEQINIGSWVGLWSDQGQFFNKLGFFDYEEQCFLPIKYLEGITHGLSINQVSVSKLNLKQKEEWKQMYDGLAKNNITVLRNEDDWNNIYHIGSADYIEILAEGNKVGYAIANKGMDLKNVIHELYVDKKYELSSIQKLNQTFSLWLPFLGYPWRDKFLGANLMVKPLSINEWNSWEMEFDAEKSKGKSLMISGLDSI